MNYFYAKIGKANSLFKRYLDDRKNPCIPIFFNGAPATRDEFITNGGAAEQGRNFFSCEDNKEESIIICQNHGKTYFFKPDGQVKFEHQVNDDYAGYVKALPVKKLCEMNNTEVPLILAAIGSNRYIAQRTFTKIGNKGNIAAIEYCLNKKKNEEFRLEGDVASCISSIELETLVAKIFEESGCFVPAYRGGVIKDIDLFAHNQSKENISVSGISIPAGSSIAIQVKTTLGRQPNENTPYDILITLDNPSTEVNEKIRSLSWIKIALQSLPNSTTWIDSAIAWTGRKFSES